MAKEVIITPKGIACFAKVFTPDKESEKFEITIAMDKNSDFTELKRVIKETAVETWGTFDPKIHQNPLKIAAADKVEKYPVLKDKVILTAKTKYAPAILNLAKEEITSREEFYSGCVVRVSLTPNAWEYKGRKGVGFYLQNILKVADGERLGGSGVKGSEFGDMFEEGSSADSAETDFDFE
jgi:hypothetical protein